MNPLRYPEKSEYFTIIAYNAEYKHYDNYTNLSHNVKFEAFTSPVVFSEYDDCKRRVMQLKKMKCSSHLVNFLIIKTTQTIKREE